MDGAIKRTAGRYMSLSCWRVVRHFAQPSTGGDCRGPRMNAKVGSEALVALYIVPEREDRLGSSQNTVASPDFSQGFLETGVATLH